MKKIEAKIIADSLSPQGHRITSYILTYPRFIHAELMTHRMFSRNSASSRAIPFNKMLESVVEDPFIPIAWQIDHSGMQGTEYFTDPTMLEILKGQWIEGSKEVVLRAKILNESKLTKQLCNRLLEPFLWHTVLVTATEFENFFELRCPKYVYKGHIFKSKKDLINANLGTFPKTLNELEWIQMSTSGAEIHIQALAEAMWDQYNESVPQKLNGGDWHIPFGDQMNTDALHDYGIVELDNYYDLTYIKAAVAVARCARLSYMTFEGEINYEKDLKLHDHLLKSKHLSPFEHCARAMADLEYYSYIKGEYPTGSDDWGVLNYERYPLIKEAMFEGDLVRVNSQNPNIYGWCDNFRGFISYRHLLEEKWEMQ